MTWVLIKDLRESCLYWTGRVSPTGQPIVTLWAHEAKQFSSATAAHECADTHRELRDSDEWRAIERVNGCERTGVTR